jgi:hypothetical protein
VPSPKLILAAVVWASFTAVTIRRLWRTAESDRGRLVYEYGVKRWGLSFWILFSTVFPVAMAAGSATAFKLVVVTACISLPLSLWGGWAFGLGMAWWYGKL